jgi:hypothetical protein
MYVMFIVDTTAITQKHEMGDHRRSNPSGRRSNDAVTPRVDVVTTQ